MYLLMFIIVSKHEQAAFHVMHMQGIHQIIFTIEMFSLVQWIFKITKSILVLVTQYTHNRQDCAHHFVNIFWQTTLVACSSFSQ